MRTILIGIALLSALAANQAFAATSGSRDMYWGVSGDVAWPDHADTGFGGNLMIGSAMPKTEYGNWRGELEVGYHWADGSGTYSGTHYYTYMANAYYDFSQHQWGPDSKSWYVSPYMGAGIGAATVHQGASAGSATSNDTDFAYQGMAGLTLHTSATQSTEWSLGYKYTGTTTDEDIKAHNIELAARWKF